MLSDGLLPEEAWETVKDVRIEDYDKNSKDKCEKKREGDNFFPLDEIRSNFDSMASFTDANVSNEIQNIPRKTLDLAGEMFVFLNSCPSPLVSFYDHILQKSSTEMLIALTQQKNMKIAVSPTSHHIADILYIKLESLFGFNKNKPRRLIDWKNQVKSVEGKLNQILLFHSQINQKFQIEKHCSPQ